MKKILFLSAAFICFAAFAAAISISAANIGTVAAVTDDQQLNGGLFYPYSAVYCGNDRLAIADNKSVKIKNTTTGEISVIVTIGDSPGQIGRPESLAFDGFEILYIREFGSEKIYSYNLHTKLLTEPETLPDLSKYSNEIKTDILGNDYSKITESNYTADKYNGILYYIDTYKIKSRELTDWWTFLNYKDKNNESDWLNNDKPLENSDGIYYKTTADAILYRYPNEINPLEKITNQTTVIVLNEKPTFDNKEFNDWCYVLYELSSNKTGYIKKTALAKILTDNYREPELSKIDKSIIDFQQSNPYFGRVIRNNASVYKYPTSINSQLTVGTVPKTKQTGQTAVNALVINAFITIPDHYRNWYFFEIAVKYENDTKTGVGFVPMNYIIDINKQSENERIVDNAAITVASDINNGEVFIYKSDCVTLMDVDPLLDGMRIRAIDFNRASKWTKIRYFDPDIGEWYQLEGFIETKYIAPDSWTATQWTGLFMIGGITVGLVILVLFIALKKAKK